MRRWSVRIPVTGFALVEVNAEDEESAIERVLEEGVALTDVEEFDTHRHVVRGNIFYGTLNEPDAEDIGEAIDE